jgi:hypothetical protein
MNPFASTSAKTCDRSISNKTRYLIPALFICFLAYFCRTGAQAQTGTVRSHQKISDTEGNFTGTLDNSDAFGTSVASLGDLDGDGVADIAVGAYGDDDGGSTRGAVWILFLDPNGTVKFHQKISDTDGNFAGTLDNYDGLGDSVASLGDLDGDGITDIAVGATGDDDGGSNRGAIWVLFLDPNGGVKDHQKISDLQGNFTGTLNNDDWFGNTVACLGDLDGDGVSDIVVGAAGDNDGGVNSGAVWILFLDPNGMVKSHQKISRTQGNFTGAIDDRDLFGSSVACLGDLDGDGVTDLAVGAAWDDDGATWAGAVWVLFLDPNGMLKSHQKISNNEGNFTGTLEAYALFGYSVASLGDLDGDGVTDIAVGSNMCYGEGCSGSSGGARGAVWVLFMGTDGTVKSHQKINDAEGNFTGTLDNIDQFGRSVTSLNDMDGDGVTDIAVGANLDDDGGTGLYSDRGAVWVLFLYECLYELKGDVNNDCKVNAFDFAEMARNWLIDCDLTPDDPACMSK